MRPTGVPRLVRLGELKEAVVRGKSVRNHPPAMQLSHAFLRFLVQYSMNPYVYPTGFRKCHFGCSAGPCRRHTGFGITYGQSCRNLGTPCCMVTVPFIATLFVLLGIIFYKG